MFTQTGGCIMLTDADFLAVFKEENISEEQLLSLKGLFEIVIKHSSAGKTGLRQLRHKGFRKLLLKTLPELDKTRSEDLKLLRYNLSLEPKMSGYEVEELVLERVNLCKKILNFSQEDETRFSGEGKKLEKQLKNKSNLKWFVIIGAITGAIITTVAIACKKEEQKGE